MNTAADNARDHDRDRGSSAIELMVLTPVVFIVILLVVQFALFMHTRQVVQAAAQQGARSERTSQQGGVGEAEALDFAHTVGGNAVSNVQAQVQRSATDVTVTVSAEGQAILPWMHLTATAHSQGPIETFTPDRS
jgi:Flp pilus assembly protein TadG